MDFTDMAKSAPMRSILLTKQMRGTLVLVGLAPHRLALRLDAVHPVEDGDRAVQHAQRALDLDGEVDVPGRVDDVDAVLLPLRLQKAVMAAEVMVMPRSRSCTIQSVTVLPSSTSPILWMAPV